MTDEPQESTAETVADIDVNAMAAEMAGLKDQILRLAAELDNTKKRAEREANDARAYAITKFARDLFGVADILERAMGTVPDDVAGTPFVTGIEMTEKELLSVFERNGLQRVAPAKGEKFDPHQHQAIAEAPFPGVEPGTVAEVMQCGYALFGRTLRPAMVIVAAKTAAAPRPAPPKSEAPTINIPDLDGSSPGDHVDQKM